MLRAMIAPVCQKRAHKKTENFFVYGSKTKEIMPALAPDEGTLELKLDWRNAPKVLEALLSQEVRTFLDSCKSAGRCLIQIKPFVPFPSGQPGPVDFTLLGVAVPDYAKSPDWGDLNCKEMSAGGPSFKTWCSRFPNPKIFVEVVSCKQMYGFGAYIEWLRENATKMDAVAYGRKALGHAHRAERHVERGNVQAARLHYGRVVRYAKLARSAPGSGGGGTLGRSARGERRAKRRGRDQEDRHARAARHSRGARRGWRYGSASSRLAAWAGKWGLWSTRERSISGYRNLFNHH